MTFGAKKAKTTIWVWVWVWVLQMQTHTHTHHISIPTLIPSEEPPAGLKGTACVKCV